MTAPIAQTQRCGVYVVGAGSSSNAYYGNVSTSLVGASETWADVLTKSTVTTPISDATTAGTQMPFCFRCPYGAWTGTDGVECYNHCTGNGAIARVPVVFHSFVQASGSPGGVRLSSGLGTLLAGLNAQGCPTTVYYPGLPNYVPPDSNGLANWVANPLTQGNGYPTITDVKSLTYIRALLADGLDNGLTEAVFDGCGGDVSTYMLSNVLFPMLAAAGTHAASGFTGSLVNSHARKVGVEANPPAENSWLTSYSFTSRYPTFTDRIGNSSYLQPSDMAYTPACIIQQSTQSGYDTALDLLQRGYRVWVKWTAMRSVVGQTAMLALLTAGSDPGAEDNGSSGSNTGDRWRKLYGNNRGRNSLSCGRTRRPW